MVVKILNVLGIVISIATGLIAITGLITRESLYYIIVALIFAGLAYLFLFFLAALSLTIERTKASGHLITVIHLDPRLIPLWLLVIASWLLVALDDGDVSLWFVVSMGCLGLFVTIWGVTANLWWRYMKRCPDCAETVKRRAQVCRFCGHRFQTVSDTRG